MNRNRAASLLLLLSGLLIGQPSVAAEAVILQCGMTLPPFIPGPLPPGPDPGFNIIRSSSSEAPAPVNINERASCTEALAGLLELGYVISDVQRGDNSGGMLLVYTLVQKVRKRP